MIKPTSCPYWVYMLSCRDGSLYTGIAKELEKRLKEHTEGRGSKYMRSRLPFQLVFKERMETHSLALKREAEIKSWSASKKRDLIS